MKNSKRVAVPKKQMLPYGAMNIMQRTDMVNGLAKDVIAKLGKETITKRREQELIDKGFQEGANHAFCAVLRLMWYSYGAFNKKSTRLVNLEKMFLEAMKLVGDPDEAQLDVEAEYFKQTGNPVAREIVKEG